MRNYVASLLLVLLASAVGIAQDNCENGVCFTKRSVGFDLTPLSAESPEPVAEDACSVAQPHVHAQRLKCAPVRRLISQVRTAKPVRTRVARGVHKLCCR
jgi:hypothetical protein